VEGYESQEGQYDLTITCSEDDVLADQSDGDVTCGEVINSSTVGAGPRFGSPSGLCVCLIFDMQSSETKFFNQMQLQ
jgi:hypothetical protein